MYGIVGAFAQPVLSFSRTRISAVAAALTITLHKTPWQLLVTVWSNLLELAQKVLGDTDEKLQA